MAGCQRVDGSATAGGQGEILAVEQGFSAQVDSRSTIEKPMSTTRCATSRPSARSTMKRAACRPIAAPSMRTVVSAGCRSAANSRSPKPTTASCCGHGDAARPAPRSCTPRASRSELQKTASMPRRPSHQLRRARRGRCAASSAPARRRPGPRRCRARCAAAWKAPGGAAARSSSPAIDRQAPPALGVQERATARPTSSCEKPTSMSIGVGVRSQVSTTGMPAASRRRRPSAECMMPVSTMPSGRRPMIAPSSASSRSLGVAGLAEHELVAALGERMRSATARLQEHRSGDRRHDRGDQAAAVRRQAAGEEVGHVAGARDASRDLPPHALRDTCSGVLTARDAVIGATPASLATSWSVTAPLLRRVRRVGRAGSGMPALCPMGALPSAYEVAFGHAARALSRRRRVRDALLAVARAGVLVGCRPCTRRKSTGQ